MTDAATDDQGDDAAGKLRSKNGVPKASLATIDGQAQKIWAAVRRGEVAPVLIARALTGKDDSLASGGTWATRIGALRLFNVVEKGQGNTFKLTELGIALSNTTDADGHARALKSAVLGVPAYANVLARYDGGSLPEVSIIASEYEYSYELSKADAAAGAKLFVESAKYAGLADEKGAVNLGGLVAPKDTAVAPGPAPEAETPAAPAQTTPAPQTSLQIPATPATPPIASVTSTPVGLNVKLDMSGWAVDDVLRVLAALGFEAPSGPE